MLCIGAKALYQSTLDLSPNLKSASRLILHQASEMIDKLNSREAVVGILGLGYVGLPLAVEAADAGFKVVGLDVNPSVVAKINQGVSHIKDVSDEALSAQTSTGRFTATTDFSAVREIDAIIIAVPTPLDDHLNPDVSYIEKACRAITPYLRKGQLISLESTTYPGTTSEVMWPILKESGLAVEEDLYLAYSPERVDPGNPVYQTKNTPKVVGGWGPKSLEVAVTLYGAIVDTIVPVSTLEAAEFTKLFENTFRAVNIALVNEMLLLCDRMNVDVWEVLHAANTKPFGIMKFMPGPGVGGHCIPLDPHYLEWKARAFNFRTRFIELAGEVNRLMPVFVRDKAARMLNDVRKPLNGSKVVVLGVAYKKDIDDWRESPAIHVLELLQESGADVVYHDPYVPSFSEGGHSWTGVEMTDDLLKTSDLVIITTSHTHMDYQKVVDLAPLILDTREATRECKDPDHKVKHL